MKINSRFLAVTFVLALVPGTGSAAQVTAADLARQTEKMPGTKSVQEFKGPDELLSAARRGDTAAQLEIAILYEYGFSMPDNEVYALAWYLLAADSSAKATKHRDRLIDKLPPAKVEEAKKISLTLTTSGVTAGGKEPKTTTPAPMPEPIVVPEMQ